MPCWPVAETSLKFFTINSLRRAGASDPPHSILHPPLSPSHSVGAEHGCHSVTHTYSFPPWPCPTTSSVHAQEPPCHSSFTSNVNSQGRSSQNAHFMGSHSCLPSTTWHDLFFIALTAVSDFLIYGSSCWLSVSSSLSSRPRYFIILSFQCQRVAT